MFFLEQSAAATVKIGPFLDETDGKTAETGLTISQADVRLSKNGGNFAQKNNATSCTHDELGYYDCPLSTTDTNTVGTLLLAVHESGALPVWHEFMVIPTMQYNSLIGGTDYLQVDTVQVEGADATNQIRDSVVDDATRIDASDLNTVVDELKDGGRLDVIYDGIKAKTDNLPSSPAAVGSQMTLQDGAISAAKIGTDAITDVKISAAAGNKIADHVLRRHFSQAEASSDGNTLTFRSLIGAGAKLVNKIAIGGSTLTVYKTDDATSLGTQAVTTDAGADPITGLDT